ncbi:hypothetical protein M0R45_013706 [Rubus argutus]|uniref:Uncharacterized protein n=1 Tax=Rubus argutus TaxID=59490 RepID=A0AAW1XLA2_RUBAR
MRELEIDAGMHRDEDAAVRGGSFVVWTAAAEMKSELAGFMVMEERLSLKLDSAGRKKRAEEFMGASFDFVKAIARVL